MRGTIANAFVAFVVVLGIVFVAAAGVGLLSGDGNTAPTEAPEVTDIENEQYDLDRFDIDETPGQAEIQMDSTERNRTVVVHAGQGVLERDLQPIVNALTANDHEIRLFSEGPSGAFISGPVPPAPAQSGPSSGDELDVAEELDDAHAFVSVGVDSYDEAAVSAVEEFVDADGRVLLMAEPRDSFDTPTGMTELQSALGLFTEPGYVYNLEENDLNYQRVFAEPQGSGDLTDGVGRVVFDTATPVGTADGVETFGPIEGSKLSTTRAPTDAPLLVRTPNTALAGDTDLISPVNALRADNDALIGNLADFLVTGDRTLDDQSDQNDSDETDAAFEAVSTGGILTPNAETEQQARRTALEFPAGTFEITGAVDGDSWESTDIAITPPGEGEPGVPVEISVESGLSGELDIEDNRLTLEGNFSLDIEDVGITFNVSATTEESGALVGSADLDTDGGSAVVVDNEFTVPSSGDPEFDDAAGLPTEQPGLSWFELELDLEFDPDAVAPADEGSSEEGSSEGGSGGQ